MIKDVILQQKNEILARLQEPYVARAYDARKADNDLIKVVIGPRRAGKSFFAMHLVRDQGDFGYVNFDDERLSGLKDNDELMAAVDSIYGKPKHLLLDEIQNIPKWELFVNRLQRQGYRLTITGSNAHLLASELATHLTGRHLPIYIFPFSFREYLLLRKEDSTDAEKLEAFRKYAETGGYPEPIVKGFDPREYLSTLLQSILYKDIVVRHRIRIPKGLEDLTAHLLANSAQRYSWNSLAKVAGRFSVHTAEKYMSHLEESFLFFSIRRFSFKIREQTRADRKLYCMDNGMATSSSFRLSPDIGKRYENVAAVTLRKLELEGKIGLFFWRNAEGEEVDFVVREDRRVTRLIQVCAEVPDSGTRMREMRALLKASVALGCVDLLILTDSFESEEDVSWFGLRGRVRFTPLWKWALDI